MKNSLLINHCMFFAANRCLQVYVFYFTICFVTARSQFLILLLRQGWCKNKGSGKGRASRDFCPDQIFYIILKFQLLTLTDSWFMYTIALNYPPYISEFPITGLKKCVRDMSCPSRHFSSRVFLNIHSHPSLWHDRNFWQYTAETVFNISTSLLIGKYSKDAQAK